MDCPCGNPTTFDECCGPIIRGDLPCASAETTMRARYTAYATGALDFIRDTLDPDSADDYDPESARTWSKKAEWLGFELVGAEPVEGDDQLAKVEFVARYRMNGQEFAHHETATFRDRDGTWFFVDGEMAGHETFRRAAPKIGRNDPCSCGSGKKFKKCHGRVGVE